MELGHHASDVREESKGSQYNRHGTSKSEMARTVSRNNTNAIAAISSTCTRVAVSTSDSTHGNSDSQDAFDG